MKINFTKQNLINISPLKDTQRAYYHDTRVNGLVLQVTQKGTKSFQVYKALKGEKSPVRVTIGKFPSYSIEQARMEALDILALISKGINPNAKKKEDAKKNVTLVEVLNEYLRVRKNLSKNTIDAYQGHVQKYFKDWIDKPIYKIKRDEVAKRHEDISKYAPTSANKAMRILRALFNFAQGQYEDAEGRSLFPDNPVQRLSHTKAWNREKRRTGIIERSQMSSWYKAIKGLSDNDQDFNAVARDYLIFVLFTGLRRREAGVLKWENVNFADRYFTIIKTKNHNELKLPMSDFTFELLQRRRLWADSSYVFGGGDGNPHINDPRRQVAKVREESGIHFTIHDLRRTYITMAESLDLSAYVIKMLVNHSMGNDVTAGYIQMDVERLRTPYQRICELLLKKCTSSKPRNSNVANFNV